MKITPFSRFRLQVRQVLQDGCYRLKYPATAPRNVMTCLIVNLRGLPVRTLPEAQTLLEEPCGPGGGRRAAIGAAR